VSRRAWNRRPNGQAILEFALLVPLLFLLIVNVVNFGGMFFAWITVANAARSGVQYLVMSGANVGSPIQPNATQVTSVVNGDLFSLPNKASAQVRICTRNNTVLSCSGAGTATPPVDPEPTRYVVGSVDVTYTYQPFIRFWDFPGLRIHLTTPPTAIHRQAAMRVLQ
jgi:Flp pilus assembly protein TadG